VSLQNILEGLSQYLEFKMDEGIASAEISPDVVNELGKAPANLSPAGSVPLAERSGGSAESDLKKIAASVASCTKCSLHETRTRTVPGQGSANPEIVFIGEAPGVDEDRQGKPFVGAAGQLLTKMIQAMGYTREEVFIGNILKCRPPGNRAPLPHEMETCLPYLKAQITLLKPKVIIALGATAVKGLLDTSTGITKLRGKWMSFEGIDLMPTYHPAYLLRKATAKGDVWEDLKAVLKRLGRKPPGRRRRVADTK